MAAWSIPRLVLALALACCSAAYLASSYAKYSSGRIGVSSAEEHRSQFAFPAMAACGVIRPQDDHGSIFEARGAFPPWVEWVSQDFVYPGQNGTEE